jgi:hypothetical protein
MAVGCVSGLALERHLAIDAAVEQDPVKRWTVE